MIVQFHDNADLARAREHLLAPGPVLARLAAGARVLLIALAVGLGKSHLADVLLRHRGTRAVFDLVIYLAGRRALIHERQLVRELGPGVLVLEPRPEERCGALNTTWRRMERRGLALLAKATLCTVCPHRRGCRWRNQLSERRLGSAETIFGTTTYLEVVPDLVERVAAATNARNPLVILDEASLIEASPRRTVSERDLLVHRTLLIGALANAASDAAAIRERITFIASLMSTAAGTQLPRRALSPLHPRTVLALQRWGEASFKAFRYVDPALAGIGCAPRAWRQAPGEFCWVESPRLGPGRALILAAGLPVDLVRTRLGDESVQSMFPEMTLSHSGTEWFNLRSPVTSICNFRVNKDRVLSFFAELILKLLREGKRVLLITKREVAGETALGLTAKLHARGSSCRVQMWAPGDRVPDGRTAIPLATLGLQGVNDFRDFEAAIVTCSFNIPPDVAASFLNNLRPPWAQRKYDIEYTPAGRELVPLTRPVLRGEAQLARDVLHALEANPVIQAAGRVRPFTSPRFVFTCAQSDLRVPLTREFRSLVNARLAFGFVTDRTRQAAARADAIRGLVASGATSTEAAIGLGVSPSTVKRAVRSPGVRA